MRTPEESVRPAPRVLSIAGSDPSGGAGIHADLKSIAANGGYGMAAITALTAQSTRGVRAVHVPPVDVLVAQLDALSDDIEIDAVKIGMLANAEVTRAVDAWLARAGAPVVVVDPVMVATSGDRLLDDDAVSALRDLLRRADVVTPNIPELAVLVSEPEADTWDAVLAQAGRAAREFGVDVVAKGGHLAGADAPDALVTAAGEVREFPGARIATTNTHGTGCSFSSAIATRIAGGADRAGAVGEAKRWLAESIRHGAALRVGGGSGPVSHFAGLWARGGLETAPTPEEAAADWWAASSEAREAIDALPFVRGLGDGSLDRDAFVWYLAQDALYLRDYSRALAQASRLAPTQEEQAFWAQGAHSSVATEILLHESWIPSDAPAAPSRTTDAYLAHLEAAGARGDYAQLVAAVLPCYWIYQDVGERLHALSHDEHPYRSWLDTYADDAFAEATRRAIDIASRTAAAADAATRERMRRAFVASAWHEHAFFAAPLRDR